MFKLNSVTDTQYGVKIKMPFFFFFCLQLVREYYQADASIFMLRMKKKLFSHLRAC